MTQPTFPNRLYSLDALRGFDMIWIMGADELFHELAKVTNIPFITTISNQLEHPMWNGFTAYDLIFPLFLFIAGVATPYSVGRELEKGTSRQKLLLRVIRRGLILVLFGFIYNNGIKFGPLNELRFPSVLGRIGLAYMFANIIYLYSGKKFRAIWFGSLLIGYWLILRFTSAPGFAPGDLTIEGNFASYIDRSLIPGRLYRVIHDPEGLFSTIPAIGTGLLGIMTGEFLKHNSASQKRKAATMFIAGAIFVIIAQLWNLVFPINKNLWTSSFVMQVGGISLLLLSVFYYIIDVLGYQKWTFFFRVIGMNSILIYMSGVFINWEYTAQALFGWSGEITTIYQVAIEIMGLLAVKWLFLYFMYKKKIFLKV